MVSLDPKSPDDPTLPSSPEGIPPTSDVSTPGVDASVPGRRLWSTVLLTAIVAGAIAWGIGETRLVRVDAEETDVTLMGRKLRSATAQTVQAAQTMTAIKVFSVFGALLGAAGGISGGLARFAPRSGLSAAVIGMIVGGGSGGLAAFVMVPIHSRLVDEGGSEFLTSFVAHAGIWTPVGAAAGLALGLGLRRAGGRGLGLGLLSLVGGALGATFAAILYELIGALAFPLGGTSQPISTTPGSRCLALILLAVIVLTTALAVATNTNQRRGGGNVIGPPRA